MADDSSFVSRCFCCWSSRKLEIIQGGRPASVDCLTAIFSKNYVSESGHKNIKRVLTNSRAVLTTNVTKEISDALTGGNEVKTGASSDINVYNSYDSVKVPSVF